MRAAVYEEYGPPEVVSIRELPDPEPGAGQIVIRVHATTVSSGDWRARSLAMPRGFGPFARAVFGFRSPRQRVLGTELAGVVERVGNGVTKFAEGEAVIAFPGARMGAHAELVPMRADGAVSRKPANLTFEEAATLCFGGHTALHFLRKANLRRGERVLVNGASGAVGVATVQLARHMGAEVTGVTSGGNADLVHSLGAHQVIDYTSVDFTALGESWDVIVDTAGTAPFARSRRALAPGGRLVVVLGALADLLVAPWQSMTSGRLVLAGPAAERPADVATLAELAERGALRPVIDRVVPFDRIVEAHRVVDSGRKRGSVVVSMPAASPVPA